MQRNKKFKSPTYCKSFLEFVYIGCEYSYACLAVLGVRADTLMHGLPGQDQGDPILYV